MPPQTKKTKIYRFLEILPGMLSWTTLIGAVVLSRYLPFWVAIFIILFDLYWVLKAINTSMHLFSSFFKLKLHAHYDWRGRLEALLDLGSYKQGLRLEIVSSEKKIKTERFKARADTPRSD